MGQQIFIHKIIENSYMYEQAVYEFLIFIPIFPVSSPLSR